MKTAILMCFLAGSAHAASTDTARSISQAEIVCPPEMRPPKCTDGSLLGKNPDGRICWAADKDIVAVKVIDLFADIKARIQVLELNNELLIKEALKLRAEKK